MTQSQTSSRYCATLAVICWQVPPLASGLQPARLRMSSSSIIVLHAVVGPAAPKHVSGCSSGMAAAQCLWVRHMQAQHLQPGNGLIKLPLCNMGLQCRNPYLPSVSGSACPDSTSGQTRERVCRLTTALGFYLMGLGTLLPNNASVHGRMSPTPGPCGSRKKMSAHLHDGMQAKLAAAGAAGLCLGPTCVTILAGTQPS